MIKREFTVVIIPPGPSRALRFGVPRPVMMACLAAGAAFLIVAVAAVGRAIELQSELLAYQRLKTKFLRQQVELKKDANDVDRFERELDRLHQLDYRLRLVTDLEVDNPAQSIYGIGGFGSLDEPAVARKAEPSNASLIRGLRAELPRLKKMLLLQDESFNDLIAHLDDKQDLIRRTPYRWPVRGFLSSYFGSRPDPFTGEVRMHEGIDIVAPKGTPIGAPANGIVTFAGADPSLGNMVVLDHGYGIITRYGHLETELVREGQQVRRGDVIGTVGSTGHSTGPHLHYEIRSNDAAINPLKLMIR